MATIGLGDLAGGDWGMGSGGRPNMSARALRRSCVALVVVLPLSPVVAWWTICPSRCLTKAQVLGDAGMGWSGGDMLESVDGVGSGTLAGLTCICDGGRVLIYVGGGATG